GYAPQATQMPPVPARGSRVAMEQALASARLRLETTFPHEPLVQAGIRASLGEAYASIGLPEAAEAEFTRVLEIRRRELGQEHRDTLQATLDLATVRHQQGKRAEAEALLREALTIAKRRISDDWLTFQMTARLGTFLLHEKKYEEAE